MRRSWIWVIGLLGVAGAAGGQVMFEPIGDDITDTAVSHDGNNPEEAYNFTAAKDSDGEPLDASKYTYGIHFETPPPMNAFWSVTMYKLPAMLLVENPINRYSIGDRTPGFTPNEDGSVTIYVQHESPGPDKESNWIPAPDGPFLLALRIYWPEQDILDGKWEPSPIEKAK